MKNINDEKKTPIVAIMVTAIITAIIVIGFFQVFWYEPLKAKYNESQTLLSEKNAIIVEKDTIITDLRILNKKLKKDMGPMADQAAKGQREIRALKHSRSEFKTIAAGLIELEKECDNLCGGKFIPGVRKALKKFEALISQIEEVTK